ncbi:MAG: DoxX family protein [Gemmatimonadota bacterium]|nr:DoxX family protein [Gemmatimonadota bacterium]MDH3422253.1 DoxX family protein [Gemmatimonadota bacterium]
MRDLPARLPKRLALLALSLFFVVGGANHFLNPDFYVGMMPPYLPAHSALVSVSGVFEIVGGLAVLAPGVRSLAGWGLIALLVAVFPANLYMALNPDLFPITSAVALYVRLPFQVLFIAWAYWATRPEGSP